MGSVKGKRLSKRLSVKGKRLSGKVKPLPSMAQLAESGRKLLAEPQAAETDASETNASETDASETDAAAASPGTYREIEVKCTDGHWYKAMLLEYDEGEEECEIYFPDPESDLEIHPDLMIRPVAKRYDADDSEELAAICELSESE